MGVVLVTTTQQTLQPGQALAFEAMTDNRCKCNTKCNGVCVSSLDLSPKICERGDYNISLKANITGQTGPVQIALAVGGVVLPYTSLISNPAISNVFNAVSENLPIHVSCCDRGRITVVNNGTNPVVVGAGTFLAVSRKCC